MSIPSVGPTSGPAPTKPPMIVPVDAATVLEGGAFGERENIGGVNLLPNGREMHHGIDYSAPAGTPIKAAADGTVIVAETNPYGAGFETVIDHGLDSDGKPVYSRYMHQSGYEVAVGDRVTQGETIGYVGSTGNTTGPHLHFEVSNAYTKHDWSKETIDPNAYFSGQRTFPGQTSAPAPAGMTARATPEYHTVQPGESLGVIAARYGVSWAELHAANADTIADPDLIHPGDRIRVPGGGASSNSAPEPASSTAVPYEVHSGDTLSGIAAAHGITLDSLIAANHEAVGEDPDLIHVGDVLQLPRPDPSAAGGT